MSDNLKIWDTLGRTDPAHTKKFTRGGGFKGTAIKPIYTDQKMTETFGPCGVGWGVSQPTFQTISGPDGQVAVYCWVNLWFLDESGMRSQDIPGVGGDFVVKKFSSGMTMDDEAFKKAYTDAIGNAMKHLGMSADVHMGLFDDNKYVTSVEREIANERRAPVAQAPMLVTSGAGPTEDDKAKASGWIAEVQACESRADLGALFRTPEWETAKASMTAEAQKLVQDALAKHPQYQQRAAA